MKTFLNYLFIGFLFFTLICVFLSIYRLLLEQNKIHKGIRQIFPLEASEFYLELNRGTYSMSLIPFDGKREMANPGVDIKIYVDEKEIFQTNETRFQVSIPKTQLVRLQINNFPPSYNSYTFGIYFHGDH